MILKPSLVVMALCIGCGLSEAEQTVSTNGANAEPISASQLSEIRAAADSGDPKALFQLARAYNRGEGVTKDISKAVEYTRAAAEKGYPPAETALGSFYGRGIGVPKDSEKAIYWYRKAAEEGYPLAQFAMAGFYEGGTIVRKDMGKAIEWLKKAADQGDAASQCELGLVYWEGQDGDPKYPYHDLTQAVKWLQKAADQGYVPAMNNLGLAYTTGSGGVRMDQETGAKWFRQAAESGIAKSQAHLGEMYRTGRGVPKDIVQAYVWLRLAEAGGSVQGKHSRPEVEAALTLDQKKRAEELIRDFHPRQPTTQAASGS
jgi:TPR repeat protein